MEHGIINFGIMERVIFGEAAAIALVKETDRLGSKKVFLLVGVL